MLFAVIYFAVFVTFDRNSDIDRLDFLVTISYIEADIEVRICVFELFCAQTHFGLAVFSS